MNSLPRTSQWLDAEMQPYAPGSKYLKTDMGRYPGGVPYLTSEFLQDEQDINKNVGRSTNGSIRTSVLTRTRDQNSINLNQLGFMDTHLMDRPVLYNLQALNWWLVDMNEGGGYNFLNNRNNLTKYLVKNGDKCINIEDAEKSCIMERFKLYGAVVNRDVDNNPDNIHRERIARDFTCTVKGVCHVLDYWSQRDKLLSPYDSCFFVLKKIKINKDMSWQHMLNAGTYKGNLHADSSIHNKYWWQIIPYHCSDSVIPVDQLTWTDHNGHLHIGSYWRCGNVHEYPDIGSPQQYEKRGDDTGLVSRNITYLHDRGRVTPIHFYLKIGDNFN